jgi:hypothetical protein
MLVDLFGLALDLPERRLLDGRLLYVYPLTYGRARLCLCDAAGDQFAAY